MFTIITSHGRIILVPPSHDKTTHVINALKPSSLLLYHQIQHSQILHFPILWLYIDSEQTVIISLPDFFITETCVYCAVRNGYLLKQTTFHPWGVYNTLICGITFPIKYGYSKWRDDKVAWRLYTEWLNIWCSKWLQTKPYG
jgi:hypothetical protein